LFGSTSPLRPLRTRYERSFRALTTQAAFRWPLVVRVLGQRQSPELRFAKSCALARATACAGRGLGNGPESHPPIRAVRAKSRMKAREAGRMIGGFRQPPSPFLRRPSRPTAIVASTSIRDGGSARENRPIRCARTVEAERRHRAAEDHAKRRQRAAREQADDERQRRRDERIRLPCAASECPIATR
jgi:hypothetical protein